MELFFNSYVQRKLTSFCWENPIMYLMATPLRCGLLVCASSWISSNVASETYLVWQHFSDSLTVILYDNWGQWIVTNITSISISLEKWFHPEQWTSRFFVDSFAWLTSDFRSDFDDIQKTCWAVKGDINPGAPKYIMRNSRDLRSRKPKLVYRVILNRESWVTHCFRSQNVISLA